MHAGMRAAIHPFRRVCGVARSFGMSTTIADEFVTKLNYNSTEIIRLAHSDPAAAAGAFWQPLNNYRRLMSKLGLRHAQEELGADRERFAAMMQTESADERRQRLQAFAKYSKRLVAAEDPDAVGAAEAHKLSRAPYRETVEINVTSARDRNDATLDAMGFSLQEWPSDVCNWHDPTEVKLVYHREMIELIKARTGATRVFCTPHRLRHTGKASAAPPQQLQQAQPPLHGVHNDFDSNFREELATQLEALASTRALAGGAGGGFGAVHGGAAQAITVGLCDQLVAAGVDAEEIRSSRVMMVSAWRSIGRSPVERQPLCFVDTRTVSADDVASIAMPAGIMGAFPLRLVYAAPSDTHRWHWFPRMLPSEVALFKQFDSDTERSSRMLHSAVHHPSTPNEAEARQSIEMRMLCLLPRATPT